MHLENNPITFGDTSKLEFNGNCFILPLGGTGLLGAPTLTADPRASVKFLERYNININELKKNNYQRVSAQVITNEEYDRLINNGGQVTRI